MQKWKLLTSETLFDSKYITLKKNAYELPNGKKAENYYHIDRPDYVLIVAHTKENQIVVEKQYRRGVDEIIYELPAGWVANNEDPITTALRELKEETGYSGKGKLLGILYPEPGFLSMRAFIVDIELTNTTPDTQAPDEDENIIVELMDINKINALIKTNEIKDMGFLSAMQLFLQNH